MKAVIKTGGKQYIVEKGDKIEVELLSEASTVTFDALMIIDGKETTVGTPIIKGASVKAKVLAQATKGDKVTIIKFQAKKRVHSKRGHRQQFDTLEITSITKK